jgi:hypothetical protein
MKSAVEYNKCLEEDAVDCINQALDAKDQINGPKLHELIEEIVDRRVTYVADAFMVLWHSKNDDAYLTIGVDLPVDQGCIQLCTSMAYWAYMQDLHEKCAEIIAVQ